MNNPQKPIKVYVPVEVAFDENGHMYPRLIHWEDGKTYEMPINRDTTWQVESADGDVAATEQVDDLPGYGMPGLILRAAYVKQQTIMIKAPAASDLGLLVCTAPYDGYTKGDYENTHPVQALADTPDFAGYDKYWYFDLNELTKE